MRNEGKKITQTLSIEAGKERLFGLPDANGFVGDKDEKKSGKRIMRGSKAAAFF